MNSFGKFLHFPNFLTVNMTVVNGMAVLYLHKRNIIYKKEIILLEYKTTLNE